MSETSEIARLAENFRKFGVTDPMAWAKSEVREGIPQYARLVFLKTAWAAVISENDDRWIDEAIKSAERDPKAPCSGTGAALKRMLASGVNRQDITDLVRGMQYKTLFKFCYQLSDSSTASYPSDDLPQVDWALVQLDETGEVIGSIDALHESALGLDPTGREMRPRS